MERFNTKNWGSNLKVVEATCEFVSCASIKKHGTASRRLATCMLGTCSYQQAFFSLAAAPTKCLTLQPPATNSPGSYPKSSNDKLVFRGDKMDLKAGKI